MYTTVYMFIGGVIFTGVSIGLWLQTKLEESHQDLSYSSALAVEL